MSLPPSNEPFPAPPAVIVADSDLLTLWQGFNEFHTMITSAEGNRARKLATRQVAAALLLCLKVLHKAGLDRRLHVTGDEVTQWKAVTMIAARRAVWVSSVNGLTRQTFSDDYTAQIKSDESVLELLSHFESPEAPRIMLETCRAYADQLREQHRATGLLACSDVPVVGRALLWWKVLRIFAVHHEEANGVITLKECDDQLQWLKKWTLRRPSCLCHGSNGTGAR